MRRMATTRVAVTYLELAESEPIRPPRRRACPGSARGSCDDPAINADLYRRVGADYAWVDRLPLEPRAVGGLGRARGDATSSSSTARPPATSSCRSTATAAPRSRSSALLQEFHGRGLGGHALVAALTRARELRPRVWLTT